MKVLFVSSGNSASGISPIVERQGNSLIAKDIEVIYFTIKGKGIKGYLSNIKQLRSALREFKPDIIHAHYSITAFLASIAGAKPLVVSLMGSDVRSSLFSNLLIKSFKSLFWVSLIVKTSDMYKTLGVTSASILPNGVDNKVFYFRNKRESQEKLGWTNTKKHILFAANPKRPEKNFALASQAFQLLDFNKIELHTLTNVPTEDIPLLMNAADVVLLTSLREGSPNVIKEAMACSRPIVATDVGDILWVFGKTDGCYLCLFDPRDVADKLKMALDFSNTFGQTSGANRIKELGLDSGSVAEKIIEIYRNIEKRRK